MNSVGLIDDEEIIRRGYARALACEYCKVEAAAGGIDARQLMERRTFNGVLLDLLLPGMEGMPALKNICPDCEFIQAANAAMMQKRWALRCDQVAPRTGTP